MDLISNECKRQWKSKPTKTTDMPIEDATALIYNVNLSFNQYQMIRTICLPHDIQFPTKNNVRSHKSLYHPPVSSFELKSEVNLITLLTETATALIEISTDKLSKESDYKLTGKFGLDGSGAHKVRHQLIDTNAATNETPHLNQEKLNSFVLTCYCPLQLSCNETILWTNPVPNSTAYTRPVSLMRAMEDREVISVELDSHFDVIKQPFAIKLEDNTKVTCQTELSMVDGKMVGLLQGDTGAFCHYCHTTKTEANDIYHITNGFKITKDYNTCKVAWEKLSSGEIGYNSKERQGQCHEPIIKGSLFCFSVLHFKLRSLDFVQKILYHLVAGIKTWTEAGNNQRFIAASKQECINRIRASTGILIDTPNDIGGNTNSGPMADRFFSTNYRHEICSLIKNNEDRENYFKLLSLMNVMIKISQHVSTRRIKVENVRHLGEEIMLHLKNSFLNEKGESWINIIPSVHQFCAHCWELFTINDCLSIAKWSECPVESWNKHVRSFQSGTGSRSQQVSVKENIHDIFVRMLVSSHPSIASRRPRPSCSVCGEVGHTARSKQHRATDASLLTDDETQFESFFE